MEKKEKNQHGSLSSTERIFVRNAFDSNMMPFLGGKDIPPNLGTSAPGNLRQSGKEKDYLLTDNVTLAIAAISRNTGWTMESSQMVYVCGNYFKTRMRERVSFLESRIAGLENGDRKFITSEDKERMRTKEKDEYEKLKETYEVFSLNLGTYARQNFSEELIKLLNVILNVKSVGFYEAKEKVYKLIAEGKLSEAYEILTAAGPPPKVC